MTTTLPQPMLALERANEVRSKRARILQPLRRGELLIGDVDLDAPELASMSVLNFVSSVRMRRGRASTTSYKPRANYTASTILRRLEINPNRRLRDLSPRRKAELV